MSLNLAKFSKGWLKLCKGCMISNPKYCCVSVHTLTADIIQKFKIEQIYWNSKLGWSLSVSKGVFGQLCIPDTMFIIHYWEMEWKPIRLWFVYFNIIKIASRIADHNLFTCVEYFVQTNFLYMSWQEVKDIIHNSKWVQTINHTIQWMDMWFRDSITAHYLRC